MQSVRNQDTITLLECSVTFKSYLLVSNQVTMWKIQLQTSDSLDDQIQAALYIQSSAGNKLHFIKPQKL